MCIRDRSGKKIGVQLGTTGDILADDVEGAEVERYNKGFEAVQALSQEMCIRDSCMPMPSCRRARIIRSGARASARDLSLIHILIKNINNKS